MTSTDQWIAEKVMGQKKVKECPLGDPTCPGKYEPMVGRWPCLPPYSTNIAAAWEMLEHMRQGGLYMEIELQRDPEHDDTYTVRVFRGSEYVGSADGTEFPDTACSAATYAYINERLEWGCVFDGTSLEDMEAAVARMLPERIVD